MTKSELSARVARQLPTLSLREVERIVNVVFERMAQALRENDRIEIRGFGTFGTRVRGAKAGRNPRTGSAIQVPARRAPFFVPGKDIRERLRAKDLA